MKYTHILVTYAQQKSSMLFRADTGILCCMHQKAIVVHGESPKDKNSYTFIDEPAAAKWLREQYPAIDLKQRGIEGESVLEVRDGHNSDLWVPEDSIELPGMGPAMRKM